MAWEARWGFLRKSGERGREEKKRTKLAQGKDHWEPRKNYLRLLEDPTFGPRDYLAFQRWLCDVTGINTRFKAIQL